MMTTLHSDFLEFSCIHIHPAYQTMKFFKEKVVSFISLAQRLQWRGNDLRANYSPGTILATLNDLIHLIHVIITIFSLLQMRKVRHLKLKAHSHTAAVWRRWNLNLGIWDLRVCVLTTSPYNLPVGRAQPERYREEVSPHKLLRAYWVQTKHTCAHAENCKGKYN